METSDKKEFFKVLKTTFSVCGSHVPSEDAILAWWNIFKQYDIEAFSKACSSYMETGRFQPKPVDILEKIEANKPFDVNAWVQEKCR